MKRILVLALSVILALVVAAPLAAGAPGQTSADQAKTFAKDWWPWAMSKPKDINPLIGSYTEGVDKGTDKCNGRNTSEAWFLAGTLDGSKVERTCNVPANTPILAPIVNDRCSKIEGDGNTDKELLACAKNLMDTVLKSEGAQPVAKVDGKDVPPDHITRVGASTFTLTLPADSVMENCGPNHDQQCGPATNVKAAGDGVYVLLDPMKAGEQHTISFGGSFPIPDFHFHFSQNNTYKITAV